MHGIADYEKLRLALLNGAYSYNQTSHALQGTKGINRGHNTEAMAQQLSAKQQPDAILLLLLIIVFSGSRELCRHISEHVFIGERWFYSNIIRQAPNSNTLYSEVFDAQLVADSKCNINNYRIISSTATGCAQKYDKSLGLHRLCRRLIKRYFPTIKSDIFQLIQTIGQRFEEENFDSKKLATQTFNELLEPRNNCYDEHTGIELKIFKKQSKSTTDPTVPQPLAKQSR
jgi:hypothetical protein